MDEVEAVVRNGYVMRDGPQEFDFVRIELILAPAGKRERAEQSILGDQGIAGVSPKTQTFLQRQQWIVRLLDVAFHDGLTFQSHHSAGGLTELQAGKLMNFIFGD